MFCPFPLKCTTTNKGKHTAVYPFLFSNVQYDNVTIHVSFTYSLARCCLPIFLLHLGEGRRDILNFWLWGGCNLNNLNNILLVTTKERTTSHPRTDICIVIIMIWEHKLDKIFHSPADPDGINLHYNIEKTSIIDESFQSHMSNTEIHNVRHVVNNL